MKLGLCMLVLLAGAYAALPLNRNEPCEGTNMFREDGGVPECDEACEDVIAKEKGTYQPRACVLMLVMNSCHCEPGFVRETIAGKNCIKPEQCKRA
ncbi:unnamed protein product, partial [Mesorhabditis spiculigera]